MLSFYSYLGRPGEYSDNDNTNHSSGLDADIYLKLANALSRRIDLLGHSFTVITDCAIIRKRLLSNNVKSIQCKRFDEGTKYPRFGAAHGKLTAMKVIGESDDLTGIHVLIDLDIFLYSVDLMETFLHSRLNSGDDIVIFDIFRGMEGEGETGWIRKTVGEICGYKVDEQIFWPGGEFIAGRSETFKLLFDEVFRLHTGYTNIISSSTPHVGDELVVAASIAGLLMKSKINVSCIEEFYVTRFWISPTNSVHSLVPKSCYLIHLPDGKLIAWFLNSFFNQLSSVKSPIKMEHTFFNIARSILTMLRIGSLVRRKAKRLSEKFRG